MFQTGDNKLNMTVMISRCEQSYRLYNETFWQHWKLTNSEKIILVHNLDCIGLVFIISLVTEKNVRDIAGQDRQVLTDFMKHCIVTIQRHQAKFHGKTIAAKTGGFSGRGWASCPTFFMKKCFCLRFILYICVVDLLGNEMLHLKGLFK